MLDDGSGLGRRKQRRRTPAERASIIAGSYEAGVTVAMVARKHGIVHCAAVDWLSGRLPQCSSRVTAATALAAQETHEFRRDRNLPIGSGAAALQSPEGDELRLKLKRANLQLTGL